MASVWKYVSQGTSSQKSTFIPLPGFQRDYPKLENPQSQWLLPQHHLFCLQRLWIWWCAMDFIVLVKNIAFWGCIDLKTNWTSNLRPGRGDIAHFLWQRLLISDGFFPMGSEGFEVLCRSQKKGKKEKEKEPREQGGGGNRGFAICYISSKYLFLQVWERQIWRGDYLCP